MGEYLWGLVAFLIVGGLVGWAILKLGRTGGPDDPL